jgi:adenylate cyclase class 2
MGHEIEAKLKYDGHEDLKKVLRDAGADFTGDCIQRDTYFDDAAGSMKATDSALRMRLEVAAARRVVVTFKGPLEGSQFKKRLEVNVEVADGQAAEELLAGLGYRKAMMIEKKRSLWHLGGCEVALDELPLIGRFVEIEGPDENTVSAVQAAIGLAHLKHIPQSYTSLVQAEAERRGMDATDVVFGKDSGG